MCFANEKSAAGVGGGGAGQQATPPWRMRDHANNRHLQLLITSEEKAEVKRDACCSVLHHYTKTLLC